MNIQSTTLVSVNCVVSKRFLLQSKINHCYHVIPLVGLYTFFGCI